MKWQYVFQSVIVLEVQALPGLRLHFLHTGGHNILRLALLSLLSRHFHLSAHSG